MATAASECTAMRGCEYPRCGATVTGRGNYCAAHRVRQPASFYDTDAWRQLSAQVRREQPWCAHCHRRRSRQVDHIVSRRDGGTNDRRNLQALCWRCHAVKTGQRTADGPEHKP